MFIKFYPLFNRKLVFTLQRVLILLKAQIRMQNTVGYGTSLIKNWHYLFNGASTSIIYIFALIGHQRWMVQGVRTQIFSFKKKKMFGYTKGSVFFFLWKVCGHSLTRIQKTLYFFPKTGKKIQLSFFSQKQLTCHSPNFSGGA